MKKLIIFMLFLPFLSFGQERWVGKLAHTRIGGGDTNIGELEIIAQYNLVQFARRHWPNVNGDTWSKLKAINPNIKIFLYQDGPQTGPHLDNRTNPIYRNAIGRWNVDWGHSMGPLDGDNPESDYFLYHDNWIQHDPDDPGTWKGRYMYSYNEPRFLLNMNSITVAEYWLEATEADIISQDWVADGIHVDNSLMSNLIWRPNSSPPYGNVESFSNAMIQWHKNITSGLAELGQEVIFNLGYSRKFDTNPSWYRLADTIAKYELEAIFMEEYAFAVKSGSGDVQFYPTADWLRQVNILRDIDAFSIYMLSHSKLYPGDSGEDNYGNPVKFEDILYYTLASFVLGDNGNHYSGWSLGSFSNPHWFDEYDLLDLGPAVGEYTRQVVNGTTIYLREFEDGYVYVNPTQTNLKNIPLPETCRQITHETLYDDFYDLAQITKLDLNGNRGAFLYKDKEQSNPYNLTVNSQGQGSVSIKPSQSTYLEGSVVSITAAPESGWIFSHWSGDASGSENPLDLTMDKDKTITAIFTEDLYSLTIISEGDGSVIVYPERTLFPKGTMIYIEAIADEEWQFDKWDRDVKSVKNEISLVIEKDVNITAKFIKNTSTGSKLLHEEGKKPIIFPNPARDHIRISIEDPSIGPVLVKIIDLHGRVVNENSLDNLDNYVQIPDLIKSGIYIVELSSGGESIYSQRLIIAN